MKEKVNAEIVDQYGRVISSVPKNRFIEFLSKNMWNILGPGLVAMGALMGIVQTFFAYSYIISCVNFYGIDRRYFSGKDVVSNKAMLIICVILLWMSPFFLAYVNKKVKSKGSIFLIFLATFLILFMQNLIYTEGILNYYRYKWVEKVLNNYATIIVLLLSDIVIAYFILIRSQFRKKKKYSKIEKVIALATVLICGLDIIVGVSMKLNYKIDDKKEYEIIGTTKAIVSVYDDKFVIMNCEIQGEKMILQKGICQLEEMTGNTITRRKFDTVVCK